MAKELTRTGNILECPSHQNESTLVKVSSPPCEKNTR
jgi:hypothetical protein